MGTQIPLDHTAAAEAVQEGAVWSVSADLAYQRLMIVNVVYHGVPGEARDWVLVDTGIPGTTGMIRGAVEQRFGKDAKPLAILQTHGHFDHVGALEELSREWDVPVYAHPLEFPYLNGEAAYPPPDPTVGGGMMSALSLLYPKDPVNVSERLLAFPEDGSVPGMEGWRWIHVPGHTPGQVSFWHEASRTLLAADAFITTRQESAYAAMTQAPELHGPPMYFTQNWTQARESVRRLAALEPEVVITGHGRAMQGPEMRGALHELARRFDEVAVPEQGKYVEDPAEVEDGSAYAAPSRG
jgi:glyoxylase-like metal-dependent hydrolase (beta-lactamase superfamily II)